MEVMSMTSESPYQLLLKALLLIPVSHYLLAVFSIYLVLVYRFFEFHIFQDFFTGFKGQPVSLTFNSCSHVYRDVVSKCHILHGRYLSTPWLCSPHFQTVFLRLFGRPPVFSYKRELIRMSDGGTVALDWLLSDASQEGLEMNEGLKNGSKLPIVIVIPGLTSDSDSVYIKHLVFYMSKHGWNVVVSNHRGLGGVSLTSDFFYNGGWTEDLRTVVNHLRSQFPEAPLYVVGTSLGANMMVKYLGEEGNGIPIAGAAAVCCPWDLLLCDRFIGRKLVQRFYDKALALGLKRYAKLHKQFFSHLADWEGIEKSHRVREFDTSGTCLIGKFETADMYYRISSCAGYVKSVKVPLLCISAIDDPVCTSEAIIYDESRWNENVVLATTQHGGHLGYFEGLTANSVWWVRAVDEFLTVLNSSLMVSGNNETNEASFLATDHRSSTDQNPIDFITTNSIESEEINNIVLLSLRECIEQLSRNKKNSAWLLYGIEMSTAWPLVGSVFRLVFEKRFISISKLSKNR